MPAPGCLLCLDSRAAGTGLAWGPGSGCGPSPPALGISSTTALKQGWEKGTESIRAGAKRSGRAWTAFLAVSEDSFLSGHSLKNSICFVVSGSGRWEEAKPVSHTSWGTLVRAVLGWPGRHCHLVINVSLLCTAPFLPLAEQGCAFSSQESQVRCLKQRRATYMEQGCRKRGKAISQRSLISWVPNWHLEYESSGA